MSKRNKKLSPIEEIMKRSEVAISAISNLLDNLKDTNESIEKEVGINNAKSVALELENNELDKQKCKNAKIISNFESLLN